MVVDWVVSAWALVVVLVEALVSAACTDTIPEQHRANTKAFMRKLLFIAAPFPFLVLITRNAQFA